MKWITLYEASLVTGRRVSEPERLMTERGVRRRMTELALAKRSLENAQHPAEPAELLLQVQLEGLDGGRT